MATVSQARGVWVSSLNSSALTCQICVSLDRVVQSGLMRVYI
jgi:hypothetical protein